MFEYLLEKRGADAPVREPSPSQLNTANYGNFLKVREREEEEKRKRLSSSVVSFPFFSRALLLSKERGGWG